MMRTISGIRRVYVFCGLKGRVLWRGGEEGNSRRSGIRMALRAKPEWLVLEKGTNLISLK